MILFLLIIFTTFSILYYPLTNIKMGLLDFISISSFIIAISRFLINIFKDESNSPIIDRGIKTIFFIMFLFLFMGFFITFLTHISINEPSSLDYAFLNGIQIGILQMQMTSIFSIFSIYTSIKNIPTTATKGHA